MEGSYRRTNLSPPSLQLPLTAPASAPKNPPGPNQITSNFDHFDHPTKPPTQHAQPRPFVPPQPSPSRLPHLRLILFITTTTLGT
ncbi:uncharacterized protein K452DRAFT_285048 [Aplosporella prunicola CBS 121167]|uniref:Uncharacterized protein n=1 Tax=Aplosporella prunicola CBS 121167 TaxID=1176127 RepID=A0A6A6BN80_9PEZI|nr:uncharacterized protein K452DRAFT_285048 [Aplosporella prunicola CBS 121167]KAF2144725.1 hypothetical protein K452DRAFT_285048 [Aplosporella prunicola CBS 121167]